MSALLPFWCSNRLHHWHIHWSAVTPLAQLLTCTLITGLLTKLRLAAEGGGTLIFTQLLKTDTDRGGDYLNCPSMKQLEAKLPLFACITRLRLNAKMGTQDHRTHVLHARCTHLAMYVVLCTDIRGKQKACWGNECHGTHVLNARYTLILLCM